MLASVVISTYNRAEALPATLDAFARQDIPVSDYEVLVVDDGSTDATPHILAAASLPYSLHTYRLPVNAGVAAGRNVGLRKVQGRYAIMISDDLLVPTDFIRTHVDTLVSYPGTWVVGGFTQLESLADTPFGRYLDQLEQRFQRARLGECLAPNIYAMPAPTARNLSLPRADLDRVGLFDERFRVTCEDQDLAQRAAEIKKLYLQRVDLLRAQRSSGQPETLLPLSAVGCSRHRKALQKVPRATWQLFNRARQWIRATHGRGYPGRSQTLEEGACDAGAHEDGRSADPGGGTQRAWRSCASPVVPVAYRSLHLPRIPRGLARSRGSAIVLRPALLQSNSGRLIDGPGDGRGS